MIPSNNGTQRKPPTRAAQVNGNTQHFLRPTKRLIEGHALREILRGDLAADISERVAELLGLPKETAERECNLFIRKLAYKEIRLENGIKNTLSFANAVDADLEESAA